MFSIDLLKGKGLPEKVDLKKSTLKALPILIPLLAVTLFASAYQRDRALLQHQHETLTSNRQQLELHTNDVIEFNTMNRTIKGMEKCLHDISKAMHYRVQVSEVFVELVALERTRYYRRYLVDQLDSVLMKNTETSLLRQGKGRQNERRWHPSQL